MKAKHLVIMAFGAVMLASCGNKLPEPKDLKDLKDPKMEDSISNLMGQGSALEYWYEAKSDTTIKGEKGKEKFIEGYLKGMDLLTDDEAYNKGMMMGMSQAMKMRSIEKEYEIKLDKNTMLQGFAYGMQNDTAVNQKQLSEAFQYIGARLQAKKDAKDKKKAEEALQNLTKKEGMIKQGTYAYKVTKKGQGANLANGTMILADVQIMDTDGNVLAPSMGAVPVEVGAPGIPQAVTNIMQQVNPGSEFVVVGTPDEFNMRPNPGQGPETLTKVVVKIKGLCDENGAPVSEPVIGQFAQMRAQQANSLPAANTQTAAPEKKEAAAKSEVKKAEPKKAEVKKTEPKKAEAPATATTE